MLIDNKLDNFFGSGGTFAGYVLFFAGIFIIVFYNPLEILFVLTGLFMTFSYLGAEIDTETRTFRIYNKIFGLFKFGTYKNTEEIKGIRVDRFTGGYVTYSRSNRRLDARFRDYRVNLQWKTKKEKNYVFKSESYEIAKEEALRLAELLNLPLLNS